MALGINISLLFHDGAMGKPKVLKWDSVSGLVIQEDAEIESTQAAALRCANIIQQVYSKG